MKKLILIVPALVAIGGAYGYFTEPSASAERRAPGEDGRLPNAEAPNDDPESEIRGLRAELREKNALIAALATRAAGGQPQSPQHDPAPVVEPELSRATLVMDALDGLIASRPAESPDAQRFKADVQAVVDRGVLGTTRVASLECADSLCKMALVNSDLAALEASAVALSRALPKSVEGVNAFELDSGEKALYLAKDAATLTVELPGDAEEREPVVHRKEDTPTPAVPSEEIAED